MPSGSWLLLGICSLSVLVLHETRLYLFLCMAARQMLWKENERSRVRAVQMDILKGLLDIRRMDRVPNAQIRELCGVRKVLVEMIDEGVL